MIALQLSLDLDHAGLKGGRIDAAPSAVSSTDDSGAGPRLLPARSSASRLQRRRQPLLLHAKLRQLCR